MDNVDIRDNQVKIGESIWLRNIKECDWSTPPVDLWKCDSVATSQTMRCHIVRYEFSRDTIGSGKKVLDLACGTGYGCDLIQKLGNDVTGVDYSDEVIDYSRRMYPNCTFKKVNLRNEKLPFDNDLFDFVSGHVFITWGAPDTIFLAEEVYRVLKPSGFFILSSRYDYSNLFSRFKKIREFQQIRESIKEGWDNTVTDYYQYHIFVGEK